MKYTHLKIFKLSLEFATYNEESVKHFDRYKLMQKYQIKEWL